MTKQTVKEFLAQMDAETAKELAMVKSPEEFQAVAKSAGADLDLDDIRATQSAVLQKVGGEELTDEQLEQVAGGGLAGDIFTNIAELTPISTDNYLNIANPIREAIGKPPIDDWSTVESNVDQVANDICSWVTSW